MTALVSKANISGTPSRATANAGFGDLWEFIDERFATGDGTAAEKAATRKAIEAARGMQPITASVGTNALTLTLNPTNLEFRSATIGSGTVNMRTVAAAISVVISSGSTMGTSNGVASRIALLAIDNAGTVELAAVNAAGSFHFDESQLISTTAEGGAGAADSASVVYSTTARSNVPFRFVGYVESTQATAGTWATSPSKIQGAGGRLPSFESGGIQLGTAVTLTNQTSVDFTGIPSWAQRITMTFAGVSSNGTNSWQVQLGDSGGPENTGYSGAVILTIDASAVSGAQMSSGFRLLNGATAAGLYSGKIVIDRHDGNTWVCDGALARSDVIHRNAFTGSKTLSSTLTQITLTTLLGVDQFDAGTVNISFE